MPARSFVFAAFAGLVLFAAGCGGSNNKGRIEGRWQFATEDAALRDAVLVFGEDGVVVLARPASTGSSEVVQLAAWKYKLLASDAADFYDLPPDAAARLGLFPATNGLARVAIKIESTTGGKYEGRTMTLTDADGRTLRLTWVR